VVTKAGIEDEAAGLVLSVITDRSVGVASLKDGELELMIQRRLFNHLDLDINMNDLDTDMKGVVARGKVLLFLDTKAQAADHYRVESRNVFMQPVIAFTPLQSVATYQADHQLQYSALKSKMPDNIHLLTLENWGKLTNNEVLVRFENFYQPDDESTVKAASQFNYNALGVLDGASGQQTNLIVGQRQPYASGTVKLEPQEMISLLFRVNRTLQPSSK